MLKIKTILIALTISLTLILISVPAACAAPDAGTGSCTRSYLLQLGLSNVGVSEKAVQIVYGYSPLPEGTTGTLSGVITGTGGKNLSGFRLHDPRIQFGDEIQISKDGMNKTKMTGIYRTEDHADLVIMFPLTTDSHAFSLYDNNGNLMKTVDLTKAENKATWNCTPDYSIPVRNNDGGISFVLLIVVIAGLVVLVVAAAAGWYFLKKRSGEKHQ